MINKQTREFAGGLVMKIIRRFTEAGKSPYDSIPFRCATSEIKNPDGSVVFRLDQFMVWRGRRVHGPAQVGHNLFQQRPV